MSHTTIVHVYPNEKIECGEELANSWGSAPYVWDFMGKTYIFNFSMFGKQAMKELWQLYKKKFIPTHQKAVLMMTFDRAYVSKENYERAAKDVRLFLQDYNDTAIANHWHHIAEIFESNPEVPAIGFWLTSVSDNPFSGEWNEEKEEYSPPNWDDCMEVYTELDSL